MSFLKDGMCPHLNKNNVEALRNLGIKTVVEFVAANLEETSKNSGISYKVGQKSTLSPMAMPLPCTIGSPQSI